MWALIENKTVREIFPSTTKPVLHQSLDVRDISAFPNAKVGWTVSTSGLYAAPKEEPPTWDYRQEQAVYDLMMSDHAIITFLEDGQPVPAEWKAYRDELRAIIDAPAGDPTKAPPKAPAQPKNYIFDGA